jgi:hypothetical protein
MADLYVPMDVNFDEHPAVLACSIEAEAVFQRALRLSKRLMTDGLIVNAHARRLTWDLDVGADVFKELEQHGLVEAVDDGWRIGGYLERNPSRDEIESKREAEKERKRNWRQRKDAQDGDTGPESPATDCPDGTDEDATSRDSLQSHREDTLNTESESFRGSPPVTEGRFGVGSPQGQASLINHWERSYRDAHAGAMPPNSWSSRLGYGLDDSADVPYADMELIVGWMGKDGKDPKHLPLVVSDFYKDRQAGVV